MNQHEEDVLHAYAGTDGRREWVSVGTWLRPGERIVQLSADEHVATNAERDQLRAEVERLRAAAQAPVAQDARCWKCGDNKPCALGTLCGLRGG